MNRAGEFVDNLNGEALYKSFKPAPLPPNPELQISSDMVKKLVEANRELVKLDTAAAKDSLSTIELLTDLHDRNIAALPKTNRTKDNVRALFDYIEQFPIIDIKRTSLALGLSYNTVSTAVNKLVKIGILKETTNASRNRVFSYEEYLSILRKDT